MNDLVFFWLFLKASLFSTGGTGNLPSLHADLISRHIATDRQFGQSLIIGQISPGPSGLWVVSLGYLTYGLVGSLLALIAITLPPLLIVVVDRYYRRVEDHPSAGAFVRGLTISVIAVGAVVLVKVLLGSGGSIGSALAIAAAAAGLTLSRWVPVVAIVAAAAVAGLIAYGV